MVPGPLSPRRGHAARGYRLHTMASSKLVKLTDRQHLAIAADGTRSSLTEVSALAEELGLTVSSLARPVSLKFELAEGGGRFALRGMIRLGREDVLLAQGFDLSLGHAILDSSLVLFENREELVSFFELVKEIDLEALDLFECLQVLRLLRSDSSLPEVDFGVLASDSLTHLADRDLDTGLLEGVTPFEYQSRGIHWVRSRLMNGLGGLLADEMGLGKTLQAIAGISLVASRKGRTLIVVPNALTENWRRELVKFAGLDALVFARESAALPPRVLREYGVVITTYDTVRTRELFLREVDWDLVVLDEAQYIKNADSQRTTAVKRIPRRMSLALTGTPVENRPSDIVSVLDFVVPGGFEDLAQKGSELTVDEAKVSLEPVLPQLMLRRSVTEVGSHLPPRRDIQMPLTASSWFQGEHDAIVRSLSGRASRGARLAAITELRQLSGREDPQTSPKFEFLLNLLESSPTNRSKALVFASFNASISSIATYLEQHGLQAFTITGATDDRQLVVDRFQETKDSAVLVMNPRAGGVGLNITAASTVVHFEPEWNPATIDQASARSYRTGQTQTFFAYYLSIARSIEEYMVGRVAEKREMSADLVSSHDEDLSDVQITHLLEWFQEADK